MAQTARRAETGWTGIILAGGRSERFGAPKPTVFWRGRTLLAHVGQALRGLCGELIAVAKPGQEDAGWPEVDRVVCDDAGAPPGPLRGMVAGLAACRTLAALLVACDTPCLSPRLLAALQARLEGDLEGVVAEWDGRPQPLIGAYRARLWRPLAERLREGERSPRRALASLPVARVPEELCRRLDPSGLSFRNLNTPEDLAALESSICDPS